MHELFFPHWQGRSGNAIAAFELHQLAQDFRLEKEARDAFESYCRWYDAVAAQHQQEMAAMAPEPDLLGWLRGSRSNAKP